MPPKLILHAGTHKTGTTAIQAFAEKHRVALAKRGVLYPDLAPLGLAHNYPQHRFAHAIAGKDTALTTAEAVRVAGLWAEAAAARGATVFLSAEPFYRHALREPGGDWRAARARYLDRLAAALAPFEVEAVLTFRRPDDYVRSLYQENVVTGGRAKWADFATFREHVRGGALRYADNAGLFAERFARLTCLVYEDLPPGAGFAAAFFAAVGVDATGLAPVGVVRRSLDPAQVQAKLALQRTLNFQGQRGRLLKFLGAPAVAACLAERLGPGPFSEWESAAARAAFLAAAAPQIEALRAGFLPERATLFGPLGETAPPVPAFDAGLAAALARMAAAAGLGGERPASETPARPRKKPRRGAAPRAAPAAGGAAAQDAGVRAGSAPGAGGVRYRFPRWKDASWNSFDRQKARYDVIRDFLGTGAVGAEIGVYKGGFGEFLLGHCAKLYLVDRWYRAGGFWKSDIKNDSRVDTVINILKTYKAEIETGQVEVVIESAENFLRSLEDKSMDFFYIDASHKYADTVNELNLACPKIRSGGHLFGDDYDPDPQSGSHGVYRAVNEFMAATGATMVVNASRQWGLALS